MYLVAGLGNPGREHARNRHNAGWMVVDELARRHGGSWRGKFAGQMAEAPGYAALPDIRRAGAGPGRAARRLAAIRGRWTRSVSRPPPKREHPSLDKFPRKCLTLGIEPASGWNRPARRNDRGARDIRSCDRSPRPRPRLPRSKSYAGSWWSHPALPTGRTRRLKRPIEMPPPRAHLCEGQNPIPPGFPLAARNSALGSGCPPAGR